LSASRREQTPVSLMYLLRRTAFSGALIPRLV
jgi:hypothetical protein